MTTKLLALYLTLHPSKQALISIVAIKLFPIGARYQK
jgi:hypothetical protein